MATVSRRLPCICSKQRCPNSQNPAANLQLFHFTGLSLLRHYRTGYFDQDRFQYIKSLDRIDWSAFDPKTTRFEGILSLTFAVTDLSFADISEHLEKKGSDPLPNVLDLLTQHTPILEGLKLSGDGTALPIHLQG